MSCQKIDNSLSNTDSKEDVTNNNYFSRVGGDSLPLTNENILKLVISGKGGYVTSQDCPSCYTRFFEFPSYTPPANINGMLSFASMADYDKFINATYLMEDLWKYPSIDFENTESEVYHLGEESLNAFDSALNFQSLRHQYDLNEFYNHDWADTASLYVEDDDYQVVLNYNYEVKIGTKYYKYISDNVCAIINVDYPNVLDSVRAFGIFASNTNLLFYNEETGAGLFENSPQSNGSLGVQGCNDFQPYSTALVSLSRQSLIGQYDVQLSTFVKYNLPLLNYPNEYKSIKGQYTIDWGDGTVENIIGYFNIFNNVHHKYYNINVPPGLSINKLITVSCQLVPQQNPTSGYNTLIQSCPQILGKFFTSSATATFVSTIYPDCMGVAIKRNFIGKEQIVNGTIYRLECKLKQKNYPAFGVPHVKAIGIFTKRKNNRWKTTKSIGNMFINLRGNVYSNYNCNDLFLTLNTDHSVNKKRKIKFITQDWLLPFDFYTKKTLPTAINADFIWKYNNNQASIGNYSEVLKP